LVWVGGGAADGDRPDRCPGLSPFSGLQRVSRVPSGGFGTPSDGEAAIAEDGPPAQNPHQAFATPCGEVAAIVGHGAFPHPALA